LAAPVVAQGDVVGQDQTLFRALNPKHYEEGMPGENHFVLRRNDPPNDGLSTAVTSLISLDDFRTLPVLVEYLGAGFGVAELTVEEIAAKVREHGLPIRVIHSPEESWGVHRDAHAVITGHQELTGNAGRKKILDFQRFLMGLARKNFHPPLDGAPQAGQ
jgi:hypothetical protein